MLSILHQENTCQWKKQISNWNVSLKDASNTVNFETKLFFQKSKQLFYPLTRRKGSKSKTHVKIYDVAKETSNAQRIIEIARDRNYPIDKLLSYELTNTSFFLTKDGALLKSNKSELVHELEKDLANIQDQPIQSPPSTCLVFDFMQNQSKPLENLQTGF